MSDQTFESEQPAPAMDGYKERIDPVERATLEWQRDLVFSGQTARGYDIDFDGNAQWGCKPTDALLLSLAGCLGIDVVSILQRSRAELASVRLSLSGERNPVPPQYYRKVTVDLTVAGKGLDPRKVERAVRLSRERYCSVYNSLREDFELDVRVVVEEREPGPKGS